MTTPSDTRLDLEAIAKIIDSRPWDDECTASAETKEALRKWSMAIAARILEYPPIRASRAEVERLRAVTDEMVERANVVYTQSVTKEYEKAVHTVVDLDRVRTNSMRAALIAALQPTDAR